MKFFRKITLLLFFFFLSFNVCAEHSLPFKKEISTNHLFSYLLVLGILFLTLFFLAKKSKKLINTNQCQILERIPIHHKTKVYILDYQGQRFLIADNQNALAIQPLPKEEMAL